MYLHASVYSTGFYLWVEDPTKKIPLMRTPSTLERIKTLPFAVGKKELVYIAESLGLYSLAYARAVAWLPTIHNVPLSSIDAQNSSFSAQMDALTMDPWGIPALRVDVMEIYDVLIESMAQEEIAPDLFIADDLYFWTQVLRFSASLLVNQHFSPFVQTTSNDIVNSKLYAQWIALLSPADTRILSQLEKNMPESAIALTIPKKRHFMTKEESIIHFMNNMIDFFVRITDHVHHRDAKFPTKLPQFEAPSTHNQWINGLRTFKSTIEINYASHRIAFFQEMQNWVNSKNMADSNKGKLCFRLTDPVLDVELGNSQNDDEDDDSWRIEILVQSTDDQSLVVSLDEIWQLPADESTKILTFTSPHHIRNMLAVAARQYPLLEGILQQEYPVGIALTDMDAYQFLTIYAPKLEEIGYNVLLPAWWMKGKTRKLATKAFIKSASSVLPSVMGIETILEFQWQVAIGDASLTKEDLEALAKAKAPLIRLKGQWMHVNPEEIKAALNFLRKQGLKKPTLGQTLRLALDDHPIVDNVEIEQVKVQGWLANLLKQFRKGTDWEEFAPPETMQGELRPYQVKGYSWLRFLHQWGMGACLADDMGLGKTIQALALIQHDWDTAGHAPVLLVCPTSVIGNWHREAQRFTPMLPVMIHHGAGRTKNETFQQNIKDQAVVITSYSLLHRDAEQLKTVAWRGVILDEAQNIKNPETKQMQASCELPGNYRLALTGTPIENNIGDLWSIMEFLNPGMLGSRKEFQNMFMIPIQGLRQEDATQRLKQITRPFILRRIKTDPTVIRDLPDKFEMKVFCTLTKEQATLYAAIVHDLEEKLANAEGIQRRGIILASITHLKQTCNHPTLLLGDNSELAHRSGKLTRMEEMLEEVIEEGDRALIFTQFAEMGKLLQKRLSKLFKQEVLFLYGQTPQQQRELMIKRFQEDDNGPQIFILSLKAGGIGINLMRANHVFHFDRWWNPAVENQATDRAFRIGQTKNVQVHKMVTMGTLEERIDLLIESKKTLADEIISNGEAWLTELSTEQLRDLISLRQEALEG